MADDSVFGDADKVPIEQFTFEVTQNSPEGFETSKAELLLENGKLFFNYTGDVDNIDYPNVLNELIAVINHYPLFFKFLNDMGHETMCEFLKSRNSRLN